MVIQKRGRLKRKLEVTSFQEFPYVDYIYQAYSSENWDGAHIVNSL